MLKSDEHLNFFFFFYFFPVQGREQKYFFFPWWIIGFETHLSFLLWNSVDVFAFRSCFKDHHLKTEYQEGNLFEEKILWWDYNFSYLPFRNAGFHWFLPYALEVDKLRLISIVIQHLNFFFFFFSFFTQPVINI